MDKEWMVLLQQQQKVNILETNKDTLRFGLSLTKEDVELIIGERKRVLMEQKRVEFGEGIIPKIIYEFCDSNYICRDNYVDTIIRLQEIFYLYKNEMQDEITDDELLHLMKEQYEKICFGDLDYLEGTCLACFAKAVRAGYDNYRASDGLGEYSKFDEVKRWDYGLYQEALSKLL